MKELYRIHRSAGTKRSRWQRFGVGGAVAVAARRGTFARRIGIAHLSGRGGRGERRGIGFAFLRNNLE